MPQNECDKEGSGGWASRFYRAHHVKDEGTEPDQGDDRLELRVRDHPIASVRGNVLQYCKLSPG